MKTTLTTKDHCEVELTGVLEVAAIEKEFPAALESIVKHVELPGFRKGKVPQDRVLQEVGEVSIWREAAETLLREQLADILKENKVVPILPPNIALKVPARGEPVEFTVSVITPPTVEITDYKSAVAKTLTSLTPTDIEKEKAQALIELSGQVFTMMGKEKGEAPDVSTLTDEESQKIGFENSAALKFFINDEADRAVANFDNQRKRGAVADTLIASAKANIPLVMIEDESAAMIETMKSDIVRQGATWAQYLKVRNMDDAGILAELTPMAVKRVTLDLVFAKIAQDENLKPDDAEVHRLAHALEAQGTPSDRAHSYAAETSIREQIWKLLGVATQSLVEPKAEAAAHDHDHDHSHEDHTH